MAHSRTSSRVYLSALCSGLVTVAVVYTLDAFLASIGLHAEATIVDDVLLGCLVAVLVLSLELQYAKELRRKQRKIAMLQEMNHHVRNALQIILYANAHITDKEAAAKVAEAIQRIEWALREILPDEDPLELVDKTNVDAPKAQPRA